MSQKTWAQEKPGKVSGTDMKRLEEHFATNWVWWQQVSNKKTQHVSGGKLDRDSPICKKLHLPVVEKIQNKASKYQIVNVLNISSLISSKDSETLKKSLCA